MKMSRVTDQGLPRSVSTSAQLPSNTYNGAICVVESGDRAGAYVYVGSSWSQIASAESIPTEVVATTYAATANLPSEATAGQLAFVTADHSLYLYNGTAWKKVTSAT